MTAGDGCRRKSSTEANSRGRRWPRNRGGLLVTTIEHFENVYDLPPTLGTPIQQAVRDAAFALKAHFQCDGVSTRQHNEPAGNQDVWHYHVHVFPRYHGDDLYGQLATRIPREEVAAVAHDLRAAWPRTETTFDAST